MTGRKEAWRRQWHPTPVLLPGKSHGRRSLVGCSPWGHWGLDTTEWLHFHFSLSCIGEGNGNPLQCSCLENPRDGGAWWAAVYRVAQSRTRLKRLSSSSSSSRKEARVSLNFRDTHRQQQEERANGAQLWVPETEDQELQCFWKLQWRFCQDGKDQGVITYQRDYMCERQWASKTCELGLTYCEKCLSLGKGPRMHLIKNLHGQEKIKKKLKSVWLYKTLKIHFPPVNLCICIHTLIIL